MPIDFERQEELVTLCNFVASRLWFRQFGNRPEIDDILYEYRKFGILKESKKLKFLESIFKKLCVLFKVDRAFIDFQIKKYSVYGVGALGSFCPNSLQGCKIVIYYSDNFLLETYISAMLHELAHYFTYLHDIEFYEYDEECTDILLIYMGYGDIIRKGHEHFVFRSDRILCGSKILEAGYLSVEEIEFCMSIF